MTLARFMFNSKRPLHMGNIVNVALKSGNIITPRIFISFGIMSLHESTCGMVSVRLHEIIVPSKNTKISKTTVNDRL